jgi:hypothetical protein
MDVISTKKTEFSNIYRLSLQDNNFIDVYLCDRDQKQDQVQDQIQIQNQDQVQDQDILGTKIKKIMITQVDYGLYNLNNLKENDLIMSGIIYSMDSDNVWISFGGLLSKLPRSLFSDLKYIGKVSILVQFI